MATFKRRQYFINKQLQTKYIALTVLLLVVYTILFVTILISPYAIPLSFDYPPEEQARAARMLLALHKSIWPAIAAVIVMMGTVSIFITHKIAGPVYRFRKVLAEVSGGNLDITINLRKRDDLKDLAEDMNALIAELRTFVGTLKDDHGTMAECIAELEEQVRSDRINSATGNELIEKLKSSKDRASQALEKYTA